MKKLIERLVKFDKTAARVLVTTCAICAAAVALGALGSATLVMLNITSDKKIVEFVEPMFNFSWKFIVAALDVYVVYMTFSSFVLPTLARKYDL